MADNLTNTVQDDYKSPWVRASGRKSTYKHTFSSWESTGHVDFQQTLSQASNKGDVTINLENADESYVESVFKESKYVALGMLRNLLLTAVVFIAVLLFQALCMWSSDSIYAMYTHPDAPPLQPEMKEWNMSRLYDHIQVLFNGLNKGERISIRYADALIAIMFIVIGTKAIFLSPLIPACQMLIRYMVVMSQIYFIRALFIAASVVPASIPNCTTFSPNDSFAKQYLHVLLGYFSVVDTCTDMIISGHTAGSISIMLMFVLHNRQWYLNTIIMIVAGIICFLLILTRAHYTIDIMFGMLFALQIYSQHLRMVSRVGRCTFKGLQLGNSVFSSICKLVSKVEMVEERVNLFIRLQHLRDAHINKDATQMQKLDFYYNIYGIEDEMQPRCVYKGYDEWSLANARLIKRLVLQKTGSREQRHNLDSEQPALDDTPVTQS
ncbi:PAP2 C-terminal family protein [Babesia bovis T2Bo]|uniref:Sphingomyelin synthase-like domain-containing protein n=1 Tax=Babesia bovis TaxID=5865 RepID=A7ANZ4_BABBO|nr:PAP2 C-terminal family protein [Babesia bovis T2Bo]EDO08278.1 PAP2 C-terminal family protein [Babesia bovis T2Bo]|eukprot:XP_001611846.1 hypothetical protein [Babesia bovis T2Bo]